MLNLHCSLLHFGIQLGELGPLLAQEHRGVGGARLLLLEHVASQPYDLSHAEIERGEI